MRIHLIAAALVLSSPTSLAALPALAQQGCPSGTQSCTHHNGALGCFDLDRDARHCGRCGNACDKRQRCERGRCTGGDRDRCEGGQTWCENRDGTQRCTDTRTDERHCGRCGNACRHQERCRDGACQWDCRDGQTFCAQRQDGAPGCVDTRTDRFNCGGCGQACPSVRPRCRDGRCTGGNSGDDRGRCEGGQTWCQNHDGTQRCTDTRTDERHCGRCGNACRHQEQCRDGACRWDCRDGQTFCPQRQDGTPGCVDTRTDRFNCGGCGQACPSVRPRCRDGRCS